MQKATESNLTCPDKHFETQKKAALRWRKAAQKLHEYCVGEAPPCDRDDDFRDRYRISLSPLEGNSAKIQAVQFWCEQPSSYLPEVYWTLKRGDLEKDCAECLSFLEEFKPIAEGASILYRQMKSASTPEEFLEIPLQYEELAAKHREFRDRLQKHYPSLHKNWKAKHLSIGQSPGLLFPPELVELLCRIGNCRDFVRFPGLTAREIGFGQMYLRAFETIQNEIEAHFEGENLSHLDPELSIKVSHLWSLFMRWLRLVIPKEHAIWIKENLEVIADEERLKDCAAKRAILAIAFLTKGRLRDGFNRNDFVELLNGKDKEVNKYFDLAKKALQKKLRHVGLSGELAKRVSGFHFVSIDPEPEAIEKYLKDTQRSRHSKISEDFGSKMDKLKNRKDL
jgi:hypothetical protein